MNSLARFMALVAVLAAATSQSIPGQGPVHPTLLLDLNSAPQAGGSTVSFVGMHDTRMLLHAELSGVGWRILLTDGTVPGTVDVIPSRTGVIWPQFVGGLPQGMLFQCFSSTGAGLWFTDGSPLGARELANWGWNQGIEGRKVWFRGAVWFSARDQVGPSVWRTDGTSAGTHPVTELVPYPLFTPGAVANGLLFGTLYDAVHGTEPWVTDGTVAGTRPLRDRQAGTLGASLRTFVALESGVFFGGRDATTGFEPWFSDGTAVGTIRLGDLEPGAGSSGVQDPVRFGNTVLFVTKDPAGDCGLWSTDGTATGTRLLHRVVAGPNRWRIGEPVVSGTRAYVRVYSDDPQDGVELRVVYLGGAGAGLVRRFVPPALTMYPLSWMAAVNDFGRIAFLASDAQYGRELWVSDGTTTGTHVVADSNLGPADGGLTIFGRVRDRIVFAASDGTHGMEPHALPLASFGIPVASTVGRGCGARIEASAQPRIGANFDFDIAASRAGVFPLGLVFGFEPSFGTPVPGCEIHVERPMTIGSTLSAAHGGLRVRTGVPLQAGMIGLRIYLQAVLLVPGGRLFGGMESTEALEVVVGR